MRQIPASELLSLWERIRAEPSVRQALALLGAACPDVSQEALANWSVGRRDSRLLTLRESMFGSRVACVASCPECGECLDLDFRVTDVRAEPKEPPAEILAVEAAAFAVRFRPPNSDDFLAIGVDLDVAAARSILLSRCVLEIEREGEAWFVDQLPQIVVEAISARMSESDPQADVQLRLVCPACGHDWLAAFDISSFLSSEIDAWAQRTLREVHALALAYGWREADILALSAQRRCSYLDLIGGT